MRLARIELSLGIVWRAMAAVTVSLCLSLSGPGYASADAPHVALDGQTDVCAMCHRNHVSASNVSRLDAWSGSRAATGSALTVGVGSNTDVGMCFACHGIEALGSTSEVQAEFMKGSGHSVAPTTSSYGPSPKQCSDCHDAHGSAKVTTGIPRPALLRSYSTTTPGLKYNSGDAFCGACHLDRAGEQWDGVAIWRQTGHAREITEPASGTKVVCSACHAPHGSPNAPSIVEVLSTASAPATYSIPANDRRFCFGCHSGTQGSYASGITYQTGGHAQSLATATITWDWASRDLTTSARNRRVGECQVCHNPMGTDNGSGAPIAKLARFEQEALCYTCHGVGSTIASDVASSRFVPTAAAGVPEIISSFGAVPGSNQFGRVQVFTRESAASTALVGPREFMEGGFVGDVAAGDIDGDGANELLVARDGMPTITVLGHSPISGMRPDPGDIAILAPAAFIAVGDILPDVGNLPEVVTATSTVLRTYRFNGTGFSPIDTRNTTGTITGLAVGNVSGNALLELAVTTDGANPEEGVTLLTGTTSVITTAWSSLPAQNGSNPKGPTIGDLTGDGLGEVVMADSGVKNVEVFSGSGVRLTNLDVGNGMHPQGTAIADVFWSVTPANTSGAELVVTIADPTVGGASSVFAFPQVAQGAPGPVGFGAQSTHAMATGGNPTEVTCADVDGDGRLEIVTVESGSFLSSVNANPNVPPGTEIIHINAAGNALNGSDHVDASGAESADTGPGPAWVAVADLGAIGPSRHAVEFAGNHVSTETAGFARHVECEDCHNVHEATRTAAAASIAYGSIKGTWGVSILNAPLGSITYTERRGVVSEYELCLKCHGQWGATGVGRDIASEIDTRNPSVHAIEAVQTNSIALSGSFVTSVVAWSNSSVLYCKDCHGNSVATQTVGPHSSRLSPILTQPWVGTTATVQGNLCYKCHRYETYLTGVLDADPPATTRSNFRLTAGNANTHPLHHRHGQDRGIGCEACHVTHGSRTQPHLIRNDIGFTAVGAGGTCVNRCHAVVNGSFTRTYP